MYAPEFRFQVVVVNDSKHEFSAETDMSWEDFRSRATAHLDGTPKPIQLTYKISGESGASHLDNSDDFDAAMGHVRAKATRAHSKAVNMEIRNRVSSL